jgi:uncharacterized protein YuzB (UPF0349 family)
MIAWKCDRCGKFIDHESEKHDVDILVDGVQYGLYEYCDDCVQALHSVLEPVQGAIS